MTDPVTTFMRLLLLAVTALNLWSLVRNIRAQNKYDMRKTMVSVANDETGEISFMQWLRMRGVKSIKQGEMLDKYVQWRTEYDPPLLIAMVNDGIVLQIIMSTGNFESDKDTPT